MANSQIVIALFPELIWTEQQFRSGMGILMSESGILDVLPTTELEQRIEQLKSDGVYLTSRRLPKRALIPGFVNTHSHAFQRAVRGRTEFPRRHSQGEDFWSWRSLMYRAASQLTPSEIEAVSQAVFVEMVKSGITRVGEFHYLHHQNDGTPYDDPDELSHRVLSAARSAGINITLLRSYYQRAGVGRPQAEGAQKIFCDPDLEFYLQALERLKKSGVSVGVTAHSVRAVPRTELQVLASFAKEHGLPFHIHAAEQMKEIEESVEEYGLRPVELLHELGALGPLSTLVHAIHLDPTEIELIGDSRSFIASCPTTERNLGDGIVPAAELLKAGARFTFGTDSQCQICLPEDARQLEYHLRLQNMNRSVLYPDYLEAGVRSMESLTVEGARSLGETSVGKLEKGFAADVVALDLEHLALAGSSPGSLAVDILFSFIPGIVTDVWCGGTEVVCEGYHRAEHQARENLQRVLTKLRQGEE